MLDKIKTLLRSDFKVSNGDFYYIVIKSLCVSFFILLGLFVPILNIIAFLLAVAFITFEHNLKKIYYLIFLLPFNHVFSLGVNSFSFNSLLLCYVVLLLAINYLMDLIKGRKRFNIPFLVFVGIIVVYSFIPIGGFNLVNTLSISATISICYFIYIYKDEINLKEVFIGLLIFTLLSSVVALFRDFIPRLDSYLQVFRINNVTRFMGLLQDPNYYALEIISLLSIALVLFLHKEINLIFYASSTFLTTFGIMTCSKAFVLLFIIWVVLALIVICLRNRHNIKNLILSVLIFVVLIAAAMMLCFNHTKSLVSRFGDDGFVMNNTYESGSETEAEEEVVDNGISSTMTQLTTGRIDIWITYLTDMINKPVKFVFGNGVGSEYLVVNNGQPTAIHNTVLQLLYCFGLLGTSLVCAFSLYLFVKFLKTKKKFNILNLIPFVLIGIMMCSLDCLVGYRLFITIILIAYAIGLNQTTSTNDSPDENKSKKKMLIVHRNLTCGGVEKSLLNFVAEMKDVYDIDICLMQKTGGFIDQLKDVDIIEMNKKMNFYGFESARNRNVFCKLYFYGLKVIRKLFSFCPLATKTIVSEQQKLEGYDYAVAFYQDPFCMDFVLSKVDAGKKIALYHIDPLMLNSFEINKSRFDKFDYIFNVSESCKNHMIERFPYIKDKVDYLYNFQNVEEIVELSNLDKVDKIDKFHFLTVARVCREKGLFRVLDAIRQLKEEGYNFVWTIVGNGQLFNDVAAYVERYNLQDYVNMVGFKANPYPYFNSSDLFLLPSYHEACPMVFFESMMLGTPVLTTNTCSANEIVGDKGFVCENTDEDILKMMRFVLDNKEQVEDKRKNLKNYEFSNKAMKEKLIKLLEE